MDKAAAHEGQFKYKRHEPEKTLLYQVLARDWNTWLEGRRADTTRSPLPDHVVKEVDAFFRCGILQHGFTLLSCKACGEKVPVAYSCKFRGFCASCAAKRASDTTLHLMENVLPQVPYRQWVTTFPHALRFWLTTSRTLTNIVHEIVTSMIMSYYEHKAEERGIKAPVAGGATFLQRFGSALNQNFHMHSIVLEGVYSVAQGTPMFHHLPGPSDEEVADVVTAVADAVIKMLRKKGYIAEDGTEVDRPEGIDKIFAESEQLTAAVAASARMKIAFGCRAGQKVRRIGKGFGFEEEIPLAKGRRCYSINGFTLHANRYVGGQERDKLEKLISYCARGAFSNERLSLFDPDNPNGDLVYELKTPWSDGTQAILLSPEELIEKVVALIPPPYVHLSRYFGILSSHNKWRRKIVLKPHVKKGFVATPDGQGVQKVTWSLLLKKVFKIDITRCPACGARIYPDGCEIVDSIPIARAILAALGLKTHPPPIAPGRHDPNDREFDQLPAYDD
jgi:hypothetical protein